jgi:hypothetical protein
MVNFRIILTRPAAVKMLLNALCISGSNKKVPLGQRVDHLAYQTINTDTIEVLLEVVHTMYMNTGTMHCRDAVYWLRARLKFSMKSSGRLTWGSEVDVS